MRGGAIPLLCWGTLLLLLAIGNWIWDAKTVDGLEATVAALIVYGFAAVLWLARRESIRRGPPEPRSKLEVIPLDSLAAVVIGLSIGCILFGLVWRIPRLLRHGVLVLAVGRLVLELRAERRTVERVVSAEREGPVIRPAPSLYSLVASHWQLTWSVECRRRRLLSLVLLATRRARGHWPPRRTAAFLAGVRWSWSRRSRGSTPTTTACCRCTWSSTCCCYWSLRR